ncbi:MAG: hypothetical protein V1754_09085 [Pseudomonadota bacterium]
MNQDPRPIWLRVLLVVLPTAIALLFLLTNFGYIWQILGFAFLGIALYSLIPQVTQSLTWQKQILERRWVQQFVLPLILFIVAAGILSPLLIGLMPQSQDHPVHLTRAWHFVTEILAKGQLSGWSDFWFAGWPAGEDYPPGGDYWISSVYLATFGLLGWEASYALAFLALYAFSAIAVYAFGKIYWGRTAGFLAALFFLLDRGIYREGGWTYSVWWGVWPQTLATAYAFFCFATLDRVIERGRPRDFAISALLAGLSIITHPICVIYYGLGIPIFLVARILSKDEKSGKVIARILGVFALGGALAAFWILPFSAKSAWMAKYGELWKSVPSMISGLWQGNIFGNVTPPVVWLGVMGAALAAWRRNFAGIFATIFACVLLFLSSSTAFQELDLMKISSSFGQIQFQRLSIPTKILFFLLAGYALQVAFTAAQKREFRWRNYALGCVMLVAIAPFMEPALTQWASPYGGDIGHPKTRKNIPQWEGYKEFLTWSKDLRTKEKEFYRIAYVGSYNDHFFAAAPVYNKTPAYKAGFTPCTNFIHKPDIEDHDLFRRLSVKYVVSLGAHGGTDLVHEKRFGQINVYRFSGYSPQRYTLEGPGQVTVEEFETEKIRLRLSETGKLSRLFLHVANYPNWRAWQNGKKVPIETGALSKHEIFISVPAQDGILEFKYTWPAINIIGTIFSWIALGIFGLMIACRFRPNLATVLKTRLLPIGKWAERFGLLIGLAILLVVVLGSALKSSIKKPDPLLKDSLVEKIDRAQVEMLSGNSATPCRWERSGRWQCSDKTWNYVGPVSHRIDGQFRRCLWAHPAQGEKLRIKFPGITLGHAIVGHHGLLDQAVQSFQGGAPVTLEVAINGENPNTFVRHNSQAWELWQVDTAAMAGRVAELSFTVSTTNAAGRHYCIDAAVKK